MKKRNTAKYEGAYKAKKLEELKERQFIHDRGIKAGYKKLLRKEDNKLKSSQLNQQTEGPAGIKWNNSAEQKDTLKNTFSSGWSVTAATPIVEKTLQTSGWNITSSPSEAKPVKFIPKGWTPVQVAPESKSAGPKKFNNWNISSDKSPKDDVIQKPNIKSWQVSYQNDDRQTQNQWRDKKSGDNRGKAKGPDGLGGKPSSLKKAQSVFARKEQERAEKAAMYENRQKEREAALKNRKHKRLEKFKVLSQKTPKGQPVMKGRMQLLLQKIQSSL